VTMHDGSRIVLRKVDPGYDPSDSGAALARIRERLGQHEYLTGLLHISESQGEMHALNATPEVPLNQLPYELLNPGASRLNSVLARYR